MPKSMIKHVGVVAVGVILAGFLMNQLRGTATVDQARGGFN